MFKQCFIGGSARDHLMQFEKRMTEREMCTSENNETICVALILNMCMLFFLVLCQTQRAAVF